jgi:hypothetical protein
MEIENVMQSVPATAAEADALIAAIEAPQGSMDESPEAPMEVAPTETPAQTPQEQQAQEEMWELSRKNVKTQVPISKAKQLAQMGLDYNEKMREFNSTRSLFETERQKWQAEKENLEKLVSQYKPVDEYFKANPTAWDRINQVYAETTGQVQGQAQLPAPVLQMVEEITRPLKQELEQFKQAKQIEQVKAEDQQLNTEISSFRDQHPDFNWDTLDPQTNLSLEQQIINHAVENKIGSFKAAARDFLFDDMLKREALKAKETVGKEIQKKTKLGLGPISKTPSQEITRARNVKSRSYDNIADEIKQELGL